MVAYQDHKETRDDLERGYPAPATPLGYLLWKSGCTWFKDWYFAEGFWEGNVKLQGNKPLNDRDRRDDLLRTRKELTDFLDREKDRASKEAIQRSEEIIKDVEKELLSDPADSG